ncbi:MAG: metalloregulator ArsR/SmtB family transcription factor, partial [Desulfobacterales bacterium]|nr:metalloregulator ArsR/SmtB family transcription factor [Desulfobacterales bacterium]
MDKVEKLVDIFKALSDPTRLRLVKLLNDCPPGVCKGGPLCVNALANQLGVTQSAVSQHLRILRQAGLVSGDRRGSFMHYSLDPDGLKKYREALRETLGD